MDPTKPFSIKYAQRDGDRGGGVYTTYFVDGPGLSPVKRYRETEAMAIAAQLNAEHALAVTTITLQATTTALRVIAEEPTNLNLLKARKLLKSAPVSKVLRLIAARESLLLGFRNMVKHHWLNLPPRMDRRSNCPCPDCKALAEYDKARAALA